MKRFQSIIILAGLLPLLASACNDDPSTGPDSIDHEEANMVVLQLINSANPSDTITATFLDKDDAGGNPPTIDTLRLTSNASYSGAVRLFHQHGSIATELTADIEREKDKHQFFFTAKDGAAGRVFITPTDKDSKNLPVGLKFTVVVGSGTPTTGKLNVVLGDFDEVAKDGINHSPESDVDVEFPVVVD